MTEEETKKLLRNTKASWQDEYGLRGPSDRFQPSRAQALEPVEPAQIKIISSGTFTKQTPAGPNLDSKYDGGDVGNLTPIQMYGALNGAPALFTLAQFAPPQLLS